MSNPRTPKKPSSPTQSEAFIAKARELGADKDSSAGDELMGRLAKTPPEPRRPPTPRARTAPKNTVGQ